MFENVKVKTKSKQNPNDNDQSQLTNALEPKNNDVVNNDIDEEEDEPDDIQVNTIKKVADLYYYLASHSLDTEINGKTVDELLVSARNCKKHLDGTKGVKLVELRYKNRYCNPKDDIYIVNCMMPYHKPLDERPKFKLHFNDKEMFFKFTDKYKNIKEEQKIYICVLSEWDNLDCHITSLKQIAQIHII